MTRVAWRGDRKRFPIVLQLGDTEHHLTEALAVDITHALAEALGHSPSSVCGYCLTDTSIAIAQRWTFTVPLEPPSQNLIASNKGYYLHRRHYARYRDDYVLLLRNAKQRNGIPDATGLRRVIITRLYAARGKPRDLGNIVGGCKPLLDAMHMANFLVDDGPEHVQDFYRQRRAPEAGVEIVLEELA